jgi:hypothetical protein
MRNGALTNCSLQRDNRNALDRSDVPWINVLTMNHIAARKLPLRPVEPRHADVDLGRVDIAHIPQVQSCLMRQDCINAARPEHRRHVRTKDSRADEGHAIHPMRDSFQLPSTSHRVQSASRIANLGSILSADQPVPIGRYLDQLSKARCRHMLIIRQIVAFQA